MRGFRPLFTLSLVATVSIAVPAVSQWTTGSLVGRIVDGGSAPLGEARVFLIPTQPPRDGKPVSVTSDARGHFVLLGLDPGIYALRADREGYRSVENRSVTVLVGQPTVIQLQLARAPQSVVVQVSNRRSSTPCPGARDQGAVTSTQKPNPQKR